MRKVNLAVYDYGPVFGRSHDNGRYVILIICGEHRFYFSNKQKAERFIKKYNRFITESFQFYANLVPKILESYFALLPVVNLYNSREMREKIDFVVKMIDKVFTNGEYYDNTVIIHWSMMIPDELIKVCQNLIRNAKRARHYQSDLMKMRQIKMILENYQDSFFEQFKTPDLKPMKDSSDVKIIQIYDPLQLALNY